MAVIQDPVSGVKAKVNADGGLAVSQVGDGWSSHNVKIYNPRITTAVPANNVLWAIRAPATHSILIKGGRLRLILDVVLTAMAEISVEFVKFRSADYTGGTLLVPQKARPTDPQASTTMVRHATATAGLSPGAGISVDPTTSAMFSIAVPGNAGGNTDAVLEDFKGLFLGPGEGLAIRNVTAAPIGFGMSGIFAFSEVPI